MARRIIKMDLNRVEGDLEIKLEVDDHTVTDAMRESLNRDNQDWDIKPQRAQRRAEKD